MESIADKNTKGKKFRTGRHQQPQKQEKESNTHRNTLCLSSSQNDKTNKIKRQIILLKQSKKRGFKW